MFRFFVLAVLAAGVAAQSEGGLAQKVGVSVEFHSFTQLPSQALAAKNCVRACLNYTRAGANSPWTYVCAASHGEDGVLESDKPGTLFFRGGEIFLGLQSTNPSVSFLLEYGPPFGGYFRCVGGGNAVSPIWNEETVLKKWENLPLTLSDDSVLPLSLSWASGTLTLTLKSKSLICPSRSTPVLADSQYLATGTSCPVAEVSEGVLTVGSNLTEMEVLCKCDEGTKCANPDADGNCGCSDLFTGRSLISSNSSCETALANPTIKLKRAVFIDDACSALSIDYSSADVKALPRPIVRIYRGRKRRIGDFVDQGLTSVCLRGNNCFGRPVLQPPLLIPNMHAVEYATVCLFADVNDARPLHCRAARCVASTA